jgi:hypothetical protein
MMERIYLEDDEEVLFGKSNAERQRPQLNLCVGLAELRQIGLVQYPRQANSFVLVELVLVGL